MKPGVRALGIAESAGRSRSIIAGAIVSARGRLDGLGFEPCPTGGLAATDAILALWSRLGRDDVQFLLIAGVAPAWYDVIDFHTVAHRVEVPVLALTFERGGDLAPHIRSQFGGPAATERLRRYRDLPRQRQVELDGEEVFVRACNLGDRDPALICRHFTVAGGRPEPIRVARLAARAYRANRSG